MKTPVEVFKSFSRKFDQRKVLQQLRQYLRASGIQLVYAVLLLYQAYQQPDTPGWAKRMVLGALAYVLAPIDGIPDLAPFFGFTDDLGVLMFGLVSIAGHINAEVKTKARGQLEQWFGAVNPDDLVEIERKIG
jgi:uncharacterized membrane protein YkvA (DUF1232 family)